MRLHLIPNSHIDPVWLWDKHEGIDEVLNTFRSACDRLDEFPSLTFSASSLQFYEWVLAYDPSLFKRIRRRVEEGRWEIVGGWWVEADTNLPLAASLLKHAEISQRFARTHFGRSIEVAYLPDSFGHPATLPRLLSESGFKYFLFCRPGAHEKPDLPGNLFRWESGGRSVLAYRLKHHYLQYGAPGPESVDPNYILPKLNDDEYRRQPANAYLFGVGDHGGGPAIAEIRFYDEFIRRQPPGDAGFSTCLRFFEEAARLPGIPTCRGDLHRHAVGCYAVQRPLKAAVRHTERALLACERAMAMAGRPSDALDPHWKTTLFNQFHDVLPGSCSMQAADQAIAELGGASAACRDLTYAACKAIARSRPVRARAGEFRVFNTLQHAITVPLSIESFMYYRRGAAFRDARGRELAVQEIAPTVRCFTRRWEFVDTLPAAGFKSYHFDDATVVNRPGEEASHFRPGRGARTSAASLSARGLWAVGGKGRGRRVPMAPLAFVVLRDSSDTWGHGIRTYDDVEGPMALESSAVLQGPVTGKLYQRWTCGRSLVEIVYSLYEERPGLCADVTVLWGESRKILKMEVRPAGGRAAAFTMQGPGGAIERCADGQEQPLHAWAWVPAGQGGLAVIQDGAFACDCLRGRLRVTLVRSSLYAFHDPTKLQEADPQVRTDQGEHRFRFLFLPVAARDVRLLDRQAAAFHEVCPIIREGGADGTGQRLKAGRPCQRGEEG